MLQVRHRATEMLITAEFGIASVYAFTPPVRPATAVSIVGYIERLGPPVWVIAFAIVGSLLMAARITKKRLVQAHTLCFGIAVFYTAALWAGVLLTKPFALSVAAFLALGLCVGHYALSRWYASGGAEE